MKRALSFALSLILLLSLSVAAFAGDDTTGYVGNSSLTYRYDAADKTLTISGKGKMSAQDTQRMDRFDLEEFGPFYEKTSWYTEVETVVIEEGVQDIPSSAFYGFSNLKSASIPKSVTAIGEPFCDCPCLEDIYYMGTVTQWNKIYFEYSPLRIIIVRNHDALYPSAITQTYPKTHIMGSKTGWTVENNKTYYLTADHLVYHGKEKVDGTYYIFATKTGELLKGRVTCGGVKYITGKKDGKLLYGKVRCDNKYYIMSKTDGRMLYGRAQCDGKRYITGPKTGEIQYGKVNFDNRVYIANKQDGHLYPNARVRCDGIYYRTDETGAVI